MKLVDNQTIRTVTITLEGSEIDYLRGMVQNPLQVNELSGVREFRMTLFNLLNEGVGADDLTPDVHARAS